MERKLSAVLATDIVGYSKLMEIDEEATLRVLKRHNEEVFNPEINRHGGRVVNLMGDGALVEFISAVEAVKCALAIQRAIEGNSETQIQLRIGINLGDIIIDGEDIFGNGVNVAARLETLAAPGGICISHSVFEQINGKVDEEFKSHGDFEVKNISKPLRVYGNFDRKLTVSENESVRPFFDLKEKKWTPIAGGCLCGEIRYLINEPLIDSNFCHCRMCQLFSGAPVIAASVVPKKAMIFSKGDPKYYRTKDDHGFFYKSSPIAERGFCHNCGSGILYRPLVTRWSDWVAVFTATFDEPQEYGPAWHLGVESQMPWLVIRDDLDRLRCKDSPGLVDAWASAGIDITCRNITIYQRPNFLTEKVVNL